MRVSHRPALLSTLVGLSGLQVRWVATASKPDGIGSVDAMPAAATEGIFSVSGPGNGIGNGIGIGNGNGNGNGGDDASGPKKTYDEGVPDNAPVDANKDLSAMVAQGENGHGGPVDLDEAKQLLEMGIDSIVIKDEEVLEAGASYDFSMDGGAYHKEVVNTEPLPYGAGLGGGEGGGYNPIFHGDPLEITSSENYTDVAPGDDYDEDMYAEEAGDLLQPFNETEYLLQQAMEEAANTVQIEVVINETENDFAPYEMANDTESSSRRKRNLRYPKNVQLPGLTDDQKRRKLQNLATANIGTFAPLACNDPGLPTASQCESSPAGFLSSLVSAANGGEVVVPCGGCYLYDLPAGENAIGGLNIIGKLYVPPNYKSTLLTPYVFVQGELEMSDTNPITPDNVSLRIVLTGTADATFSPADSNSGVAGTPFNAGSKAFLVAGGKLTVRGWDESESEGIATWSPLLGMAEGARPTPDLSSNLEKSVRTPLRTLDSGVECPRQIINHDFDQDLDYSVWSAGEGAIVSHDDVAGTMVVTNINKSWQGPRLDFTKYTQDCPLIEGATYLITLRIKVDKEGFDGQTTPCEETNGWNECLKLTRKIMFSDKNDRYSSQKVNRGFVGKYGEWFTLSTTWTYVADDLGDNVIGNVFALESTEPGTTVSIDDFVFELPSERSFPVASDACQELVVNGDAENADGAGWSYFPMWSSRSGDWQPNIYIETLPNGKVNKFFRASNRRWHSDSIRTTLLKECFVKGLVYTVSLKVRIQKDIPLSYYVQLKGPRADGSGWTHKQPLFCPEQSQDQGWVSCSGPFVIDEDYEAIGEDLHFEVIFDYKKDTPENAPWAVVDYDDISISFTSGPAEGLKVDGAITARWGPNAGVHITSSTLSNRDSQNAIIESVVAQADGSATLKLQSGIDAVISEKDEPGQGVEVALVSRNIVIEGESSDNPQLGGYFQVFHTPGVSQTIEGVEFINMGQQQGKNRFALQLLYTGDVPGTSISRNSIHHSNHRCIVVEGTSNATISSNVAYETAGHCYWFGHESMDNLVTNNIGSRTNNNINWNKRLSGHSDHDMATFAIYSPLNDFISNIAAGSDGRGFYMYNDWRTLGEDLVDTGKGSLRRLAMRTFKDNKSHSNSWQGFALYDFEQFFTFRDEVNVPVFENLMAYRNQNHAIHANNIGSAVFRGGVIQDNQWGIYIERSDGISIENMEIRGYTDLLKEITTPSNRLKLCRTQDWRHEGLTMMNTRWRYGEEDNGNGLRMKNVTFSDFDKNTDGCVSSWPIAMMSHKYYDTHFDYVSSWENVQVIDSRGFIFDGCGASQRWGFNDVVINDLDGSLYGTDDSAGPSALVSNFPHMTRMFGDKCTVLADNCMAYCTDVCLRTFYYNVEQFGTENWKLVITNANGDRMEVSGIIEASDNYQFTDAWKYMKFPASLPAGTYTAEFIDENGNQVWPTFVEEQWENPPDCSGYASPSDITILKPEVSGPSCDELVRNGGQDASLVSSDPWLHTHPGVEVGVGLGIDGSDAIKTTNRKYHWTGLGQNIDTRCIKLMEGHYFEFSARIKMLDSSGNPATVVDPDREWYRNMSPILTINAREYRDASTKQYTYTTEDRDKAWLARPYKPDGWNLVHGLFRLPENSPRVFWEIERAPDNIEFIIDNASMKPVVCNPDMLVKNGNLEDDVVSKYWDTWGGEVGLDIVPGYGGSGNALKAFKRPHYSHGPAQIIDMDCVNAGDRLAFRARIKFESNGATTMCNPYTWSSDRCSDFFLYTYTQGTRHYRRVAWIASDDPIDGWYEIAGVYTLNEDQANAEFAKVYFDGAVASLDVIVDDVEVNKISSTCQELILNPSFEESTAFWSFIDRGYSKVGLHSPGAAGASDFALRSYDRGSSEWRGIRQQLDNRCFTVGAEYTISAKFRLLNPSTGEGEVCDTNVQYNNGERTQCPSVVVYGWQCQGGDVYWRFWNQIPEFDWNKDGFNDFENSFVVTDQLASCETVHIYVHQVNRNWDIVMDDVKISAAGTDPPTYAPTLFPTANGVISSPKPTVQPTSMPTVITVTECPSDYSAPVVVPAGPIMLAKSNSLCILTKAIVNENGVMTKIAPIARSYDGRPWEKAAGDFSTMLLRDQEFGDYTSGSQITLPNLDGGAEYFLTSYTYTLNEENTVARLLESGTFGTTLNDLTVWESQGTDAATWVDDQMKKPMTSHREFFRQRVNPRFAHSLPIGRSDHPCKGNSRWRKYAFAKTDGELWWKEQWFEAKFNQGDEYITIKLNGHVRTVVESIAFKNPEYTLEFNKKYKMRSRPREYVGGDFYLYMDDGTYQSLVNPPVTFFSDSIQPPQVLNLPALTEAGIDSIDEYRSNGGEFILYDNLVDPLCSTLNEVSEDDDTPVFGKLPDGSWLIYDPRLKLEENTPTSHLDDGGGMIQSLTGGESRCVNAPRTFLNENQCTLSFSLTACGSSGTPDVEIELNADNIALLHTITGQYVYGVLGLPVVDHENTSLESPCTVGLRSRWEIRDAGECTHSTLGAETNSTLVDLLSKSSDTNRYVRDIIFPTRGYSCAVDDTLALDDVELVIGSVCYKRVHPDHMSVYDFTYWTLEDTHPGNMVAAMEGEYNPIKKWMDLDSNIFLTYPSFPSGDVPNHSVGRWNTHSTKFPLLGRFGDTILFVDLPNEIRLDEVAQHFGESSSIGGSGVVVCGSPNETPNDPAEGYQFDVSTRRNIDLWGLGSQREHLWVMVGLTSEDQLRQRVAWALSQLLVVVPGAVSIADSHTEAFLTYYDIFVRNAFGNYGDILREISYSPLMAENLSFLQSKSAAYMWETQGKISFADENFAREIMQLFSTGLYLLNLDGTQKLDDNGQPIPVYSNDEIMSFSRVWTGFDYQQARGNVEETSWSGNRHDPMRIQSAWRDKFPKTDLTGGYIGDGYPLCVDLPDKMFLRKGAKYRLLGSSSAPELMEDHSNFKKDPNIKKFVLDDISGLKERLCNASNGECQYDMTVTLDANIDCTGNECKADTVRVVDVGGIYYEYLRPPCVEQAFYNNARKVIYRERWADSSCANPLLPYASEACCVTGDLRAERYPDYLYDQERVLFSTADSRCNEIGKMSCDFNDIGGIETHQKGYHWSTDKCQILLKVNAVGQVAIVYEPDDYAYLHPHIREDNRNFFKVYWTGDFPKNDEDVTDGNNCGNGICESLVTGGCLCQTVISETRVFSKMPANVEEVLANLNIGAYDPSAFDSGTYVEEEENGVKAYLTSAGSFDADTVFEVTDEFGRIQRFKNAKESVRIQGAPEYSFRNAPSFMSILNTEADVRDAEYETQAALDHYLHHDNTAPFIAIRLIQRFTTSNPNPRYVKEVATAFRSGKYGQFGTGAYGDLAATIAAVLLDPEARSVTLDADPFRGSLREPILRVMAVLRSMEIEKSDAFPVLRLEGMSDKIGQMAHSFPTVFSFFLPEYQPDGRPGDATLVGPETMIMDMPKMVGMLNGLFSLVKYGLSNCDGGFGAGRGCTEGDYSSAAGRLALSMPYIEVDDDAQAEAVVSKLTTLLTSGRLSDSNKEIIKNAYKEMLPDTDAALRMAQQLILTAPEFHSTNTVTMSGEPRGEPELPQPSGSPYKAIVYVMFGGGCDSYNMLVPHTCTGSKDMYAEYLQVREEIALPKSSLLEINALSSNQICETFGLHPKLQAVQGMYNDGDLLFFTNTGVLTKETDKENWWRDTATQLFAHNWMQREAERVDPLKEADGTGILGRIADALNKKGRSVGTFSIERNTISLIGTPGLTSTPFILSRSGVSKFNNRASSESMESNIAAINNATTPESGVFGDYWSETLVKSLSHNKLLYNTLSDKQTVTTFPNSYLGSQLAMVAKMIDSRTERGSDADMFFLSTGGWDTHSDVLDNMDRLFTDVDNSFKAFADEMKAKGVWDSVTVIETSDFARTLAPNTGRGSDHAWGGNYMMFGGGVKGGQIVGTYPDNLTDDGPRSLGRGRMIPTTSWDAVFLPLAEWAGATNDDLPNVCPNKDNFPASHFIDTTALFEI